MRRETPENQQHHCSSPYGAGTRVEAHRSRFELERVLHKYGADEVLFVEADANASIQFAMEGRYVQLALPLPSPQDSRFTHTPSGKLRTATAQERAYEQALREHWRSLVVAVRGKLQSVESGISTFEQEFDRFLVPQFADEKKKRNRKAPKAVNWLLGGSHTLAIALVAAFLVPASAVGAFALPTKVVGHLAAPFRSAVADESAAANQGGSGLALARGGWSPSSGNASADSGRLLALRSQLPGQTDGGVRQVAALTSPPAALAPAGTTPLQDDAPPPPAPPSPARPSDGGRNDSSPPNDRPAVAPPEDGSDSTPAGDAEPSDPSSEDQPAAPTEPSSDDSSISAPATDDSASTPAGAPAAEGASTDAPTNPGSDTPPGNGNGNANGQNGTQGQGNGQGNGNGSGNGNANGQNGTQGQGNGQAQGQGQGNGSQGNGKAKGG